MVAIWWQFEFFIKYIYLFQKQKPLVNQWFLFTAYLPMQTGIHLFSLIIITATRVNSIGDIKIVLMPQAPDITPPIPAPIAKIIIMPKK